MSAFQCSPLHTAIVALAPSFDGTCIPSVSEYEESFRMLWAENRVSLNYRYGCEIGEIPDAPPMRKVLDEIKKLKMVDVLSLIDSYCYQSCESDGWLDSRAFDYANGAKSYVIRSLPGYDTALWTI